MSHAPDNTAPEESLIVEQAARSAVAGLRKLGLRSCLLGPYAIHLHLQTVLALSLSEEAQLLVLISSEARSLEQLKRDLAHVDPSFVLVAPPNPYTASRALWYRPSSQTMPCKIELHLLGHPMDIPPIPRTRIQLIHDLPTAPLSLVFLVELLSWERDKPRDSGGVGDLDALLVVVVQRYPTMFLAECEAWMSIPFVTAAKRAVLAYVGCFPSTANAWRALGFRTGAVETGLLVNPVVPRPPLEPRSSSLSQGAILIPQRRAVEASLCILGQQGDEVPYDDWYSR